jgi:Common central domain of tyrosinase
MLVGMVRWLILPLLVMFYYAVRFLVTYDINSLGFDPIFFLHHANVDRMLSLWEALNPGVWVSSGPAEGGSWTISGNATIGPHTSMWYSP